MYLERKKLEGERCGVRSRELLSPLLVGGGLTLQQVGNPSDADRCCDFLPRYGSQGPSVLHRHGDGVAKVTPNRLGQRRAGVSHDLLHGYERGYQRGGRFTGDTNSG